MSCKKQFSDEFFSDSFSQSFRLKRFKAHREDILLALEMARMPETQPHVEHLKKQEKLREEIDEVADQIKTLKMLHYKMIEQYRRGGNEEKNEEKKEDAGYVCACPVNECRGFLSSKYICGICGVKACSECREVKEDNDHKCNPDTVETVNELKKTCRNCPNCMTAIFKISGCDQMFCTKCNVAFSWTTGKVEKGVIHNPHYFEWLTRQNGAAPRNPHEVRCGGMPDGRLLADRPFRVLADLPAERMGKNYRGKLAMEYLMDIYRQVQHIRNVDMRALPTVIDNQTNLDLRIEYLTEKITKDEMKVKLQRREKDRLKKLEYRDILDMYCTVMQDMFYRLLETKNIADFIAEEIKLQSHANKAIEKVNKRYNSKLHPIE
jgi:hypothetical protein